MEKSNSLSTSFSSSITNNLQDPLMDTAEVVLDSVLDDGVLKDIPVVKYVVSAYKLIDDIRGRFYLRKLEKFIFSFNARLASEKEIEEYRAKFSGQNRDSELSYILAIIDKYVDMEKPSILAKLFLAYLDQTISWSEFCAYSEVLDKILVSDLRYLQQNNTYTVYSNRFPSELLRLTGVGLMYSYQHDSVFESDGHGGIAVFASAFTRVENQERVFSVTLFGKKFKEIVYSITN